MQMPDKRNSGAGFCFVADIRDAVRAAAPRVHCITNSVAQNFTANVLLAAGGVPAMTIAAEEVADFVASSGAMLVNLGTLDRARREAIDISLEIATQYRVPWVLDPVFIERVPARGVFAKELMVHKPSAIRLNAAEFTALSGDDPVPERIARYARANGAVIALSGETDFVTDGDRHAAISNGHPLMASITATGCAASSLVAACIAVESDVWRATVAALTVFGIAGEVAAEAAQGPGSLAIGLIDALHAIDAKTIAARARVS